MSHAELRREAERNHSDKLSRFRAAGGGVDSDKRQDEAMIRKAIGEHDAQLHGGKHTKLKFAAGGGVDEAEPAPSMRRDRRARGGSAKHKGAHVNVIVAPQGGGGGPPPVMPVPAQMWAPPPHPPMPPPGAMPPPGMGGPPPGGMPPGGPPPGMIRARGGRTGYAKGGRANGGDVKSGHPYVSPQLEKTIGGAADAKEGRDPEWSAEDAETQDSDNPRRLNKIVRVERAAGGKVGALEDKAPSNSVDIDDGAGGGAGRLEKIRVYGKAADKGEGAMKRGGGVR